MGEELIWFCNIFRFFFMTFSQFADRMKKEYRLECYWPPSQSNTILDDDIRSNLWKEY